MATSVKVVRTVVVVVVAAAVDLVAATAGLAAAVIHQRAHRRQLTRHRLQANTRRKPIRVYPLIQISARAEDVAVEAEEVHRVSTRRQVRRAIAANQPAVEVAPKVV